MKHLFPGHYSNCNYFNFKVLRATKVPIPGLVMSSHEKVLKQLPFLHMPEWVNIMHYFEINTGTITDVQRKFESSHLGSPSKRTLSPFRRTNKVAPSPVLSMFFKKFSITVLVFSAHFKTGVSFNCTFQYNYYDIINDCG